MRCAANEASKHISSKNKIQHFESGSPLKIKNTQAQVNFPGSCIKKSVVHLEKLSPNTGKCFKHLFS